jgi:hypothetical protein
VIGSPLLGLPKDAELEASNQTLILPKAGGASVVVLEEVVLVVLVEVLVLVVEVLVVVVVAYHLIEPVN